MDRNKTNNRNQKKITSHIGSEFFALGSKSTDHKKGQIERKRESTSNVSNAAKKPKLASSQHSSDDGTSSYELWEQMATECDPIDLIETVWAAIDQNDNDTVLRLICGSVKLLSLTQGRKYDFIQYIALLYLTKLYPSVFGNDMIMSALVHILRRETSSKVRLNHHAFVMSSNILTASFLEKQQWPELFFRIYSEDAMNERLWVDNEFCQPFVQNLLCAFDTIIPHSNLLFPEVSPHSSSAVVPREVSVNMPEDDFESLASGSDVVASTTIDGTEKLCPVKKRFLSNEKVIQKYVIDSVKEQLNRRQHQECHTRNFVKYLCAVSGLGEIRNLCISRLELWIHNGKLIKCAQQFLAYICFNIRSNYQKDQEVLATLIRMRLKTKPLINFYMMCIKEMIILQPDTLRIVLKLVVQNELSNTRNPNNMGMLATMFQTFPDQSAIHLAEIYTEYLLQRDDCLRTLRVFMRELVKMLRFDFNIVKFCKVFLNGCPVYVKQMECSEFKDRIFQSMVDITCLCMFLTVSPQVRESMSSIRNTREMNCSTVLLNFFGQMTQIQLESVTWMYQIVPNTFKPEAADYKQALYKLLLLENVESYSRCDQWPSEPERTSLMRLTSETPIHEEALMRIILIGITKEIPFSTMDTIDIIMLVIKRASSMKVLNYPAVESTKFDIIDFLFSMAEYHHPDNIKLPIEYEPPKLAITVLYWKVWLIMLMISAHNPGTFGAFCWNHYPTMKMLIEMCITNQFEDNNMVKNEHQILSIEREHILEFETYLASQTITEENTILISQLMLMDPMGPARKVPNVVLEQLRILNKSLKLGHLLCRCRKPDLLLDIIQRQGTTQSMPWLSDLVQNSNGDFSHLPVQCLCEFLLFNVKILKEDNSRDAALVNFLKNLVMDGQTSTQTLCEVLDYVFRRLSSTVKQSRVAALGGLKVIFNCESPNENNWLLRLIPEIPHFKEARPFIITQLRSACQVENSPELIMAYIKFIATHTLIDNVTDMLDHVFDMAQLIVERSTMFQNIIPPSSASTIDLDEITEGRISTLKCLFVMFNNYFIKLKEHNEPYEWAEYPDLLMVQFKDGIQLPLHLNIIHAFIILLTYSNNNMSESLPVLEYWFSAGKFTPIAFLPGGLSQEHVELLPDWLKLRMIRSSVDRLIEAALYELTPDQIVLFVQNFGTPINSMSKLLALLDRAVIEQFDAVKNAILNKSYLAQLISVQQLRGAKNGHFTIQALKLGSDLENIPPEKKLANIVFETIDLDDGAALAVQPKRQVITDIESRDLFTIFGNKLESKHFDYYFRALVRKIIEKNVNIDLIKIHLQNALTNICNRLLKFQLDPQLDNSTNIESHHICTIIRLLQRYLKDAFDTYEFYEILHTSNVDSTIVTENNEIDLLFRETACFSKSLYAMLESRPPQKNSFQVLLTQLKKNFVQNLIEQVDESHANVNYNLICKNGILVDWISVIDPELTTVNNHLFNSTSGSFQYLLLSRMCHQTNWSSQISILNHLLKQFDKTKFNTLNFIEALIDNPKLWQGRDKCVSKNENFEKIITFNPQELKVFTDFILNESNSEFTINEKKCDLKLYSRINLLIRTISNWRCDLAQFLQYVTASNYPKHLKTKALQQIYIKYPSVKFVGDSRTEEFYSLSNLKGCRVDKVTNYLITCLGNLLQKKDYEALSSDTELLIRKLAATHPLLLLRQLGVLSSIIQGRDHFNLRALKDEYHYHRLIQILRMLELLQDVIFDDIYESEFQNILCCYFKFLRSHANSKDIFNILIKFLDILHLYLYKNPKSACLLIEQHVYFLLELASKFHNIATLHHIIQGISLLQKRSLLSNELSEDESKQDYDIDEQAISKNAPATNVTETDNLEVSVFSSLYLCGNSISVLPFGANKIETLSPHLYGVLKTIRESYSDEAILNALQEIESFTSKRYSFLNEVFEKLLEFLFSSNTQIRSYAYILLIRFLKQNSGRSDLNRCTLNAYVQCLRNDNCFVAATAVDNLDEMTLLLQEYATEILCIAFSLGIRSKLNTSIHIKRVTQTLLLQYGY